MRAAAQRVDALGYDSLWTWDHLYPIVGDIDGPFLEGYIVIAGWSQVTTGPTIGLLVGANTFRNPALVVKMITTLDHLSGGRAVLGIGAAWFDTEHAAFGIEFGKSLGERIGWLDEAVELMRAMLHEPSASARGPRYATRDVMNDPAPLQARPADPHRRLGRAQDAPDRRSLRGHLERRQRDTRRGRRKDGSCAGGATRSDGTRTRSSGPSASDRSSSGTILRTRRPGSRPSTRPTPGRTGRSSPARPTRSRRSPARTWRGASDTSSTTSPRPTTTRPSSASRRRSGRSSGRDRRATARTAALSAVALAR